MEHTTGHHEEAAPECSYDPIKGIAHAAGVAMQGRYAGFLWLVQLAMEAHPGTEDAGGYAAVATQGIKIYGVRSVELGKTVKACAISDDSKRFRLELTVREWHPGPAAATTVHARGRAG